MVDVEDLLDHLADQRLSGETIKGRPQCAGGGLHGRGTGSALASSVQPGPASRYAGCSHVSTRRATEQRSGSSSPEGNGWHRVGALACSPGRHGARIGEVLAAKWSDFDMRTGVWTVSATMTRDADLRVVMGDRTKTGRTRSVVIGPTTMSVLLGPTTEAARLPCCAPLGGSRPCVSVQHWDSAGRARNLRNELRPIAATVGFPGSFHQLRHFVASVALSQTGGNDVAVARMLGHAKTETTRNVYGHLIGEDAVLISEAIERHLVG